MKRGVVERSGRERRGERGRHVGCMAAESVLLYQEAPVGRLLPNYGKPHSMPNTVHLLITLQLLA